MLAQAISALVAFGVLPMRGVTRLTGWQWLFIIEGLFGLVVGAIFVFRFPKDTRNPNNVFKHRYFSERESEILVQRLLLDDATRLTTTGISQKKKSRVLYVSIRIYFPGMY
ncbi:hypothetical protein BGW36DRAFT_205133 [Talaromyces proteolyticus]|uniref:Major facilitator superfamily (MFS) profile domain-containing protein n=1 Tax=Talaromyces proteolyticus TaxID=1131652 RepID=A0AAD4PZE5_9EURO|nr:uncharacterized protein BGW36DRAFT_205133 [Talaromyces proteolyticus]KAH8695609.1 hypothetical protein BGW36DRAFT_205133 [Talaromyces proteolyticus]